MARVGKPFNVAKALGAISSTGDGHCWYCDEKLPAAKEAMAAGWDVQRVEGGRVASIILVCPTCLRQKKELGEEDFLNIFPQRVLHTVP